MSSLSAQKHEIEALKYVIANRHSDPKAKEIFDKIMGLVSGQDEQRGRENSENKAR